jgi:hypothetical protein
MNSTKQGINERIPVRNALMQRAKYLFMVAVFMALTTICFADGPSDGETNPDETNTPFDGGVSLLVAAGVVYGIKKRYDARKNDNNMEERNTI